MLIGYLRGTVDRDNLVAERKKHVEPLIDKIYEKLDKLQKAAKVMLSEPIRKAVNYILSSKEEFKSFLEHPDIEPSNNRSEQNLRFVTIGRKTSFLLVVHEAEELWPS